MTAIVLHGRLKRDFGGPYNLNVASAAEAVRALMALVDGFRAGFRDGAYRVVYGPQDAVKRGRPTAAGLALGTDELHRRTGAPAIHIVPVAAGGGRGGGVGKVILGAVLIAAAFVTGGGSLAGSLSLGSTLGSVSLSSVAMFGATMMVGGISQMLSPMPRAPKAEESEKTNSYLLGGQINVYDQGGPVALAYGTRVRVGATLVSAGLDTAELMGGGLKAPASGGAGGGSQVATVTAPGPLVTSERGYGPITLTPGAPGLHGFRITGIETPTDLVRGAVNVLGQGGGAAVNEGDVLTLAEGAAGVSFRSLVGGGQDSPIWPVFPKMTVQQMKTPTEPYGEPVLFGATGSYVGESSDGGSGSAVGAPDNSGGPGHSDGNW